MPAGRRGARNGGYRVSHDCRAVTVGKRSASAPSFAGYRCHSELVSEVHPQSMALMAIGGRILGFRRQIPLVLM